MAYLKILGQWAFEFLALYALQKSRETKSRSKRKPKNSSDANLNGSM